MLLKNNRNLFLTVLEVGSSRSTAGGSCVPADCQAGGSCQLMEQESTCVSKLGTCMES